MAKAESSNARIDLIIKEREKKLDELRKQGINPYPTLYEKKDNARDLQKVHKKLKPDKITKTKAKIAGRVLVTRDMGKIIFSTLQDASGQIQIVLQKGSTPPSVIDFYKKFIDSGDFVGIEGIIARTKRGELSVLVKKAEILTKSLYPLPDKWYGLSNKEERYRKRYLDLIMNPKVKEVFEKRQKTIDAMREFLKSRGYAEVDTPVLQPLYGGTSARPFTTNLAALNMRLYMRISNEMYLKRLIVGGYEKIFEFSKDFRNEGIDATHNPEFTLMETMCAYADYNQNMDLVEELLEYVAKKVNGSTKVNYQGKVIDFKRPWKRYTMKEALKKFAKIDVEKMTDAQLKAKLYDLKIQIPVFKRGIAMEEIFSETVEPKLIQPTLIYDYPFETCGLAKPKKDNPAIAERFEPYVNGWELGNIYSELNDPQVLEAYWREQENMLSKDDEAQRLDHDFLFALKVGMPPTSGVGIGVDRLIMLLTDAPSIRDVILFPFMKPLGYKEIVQGKSKDTNVAVAIINKSLKLEPWEKMNTIAHLNAAFGARLGKQLLLQDEITTKDDVGIKLNIQHAIMIKEAESKKQILDLIKVARENELEISEFTREMINTTDDKKVVDWTKEKDLKDIEYLGVLVFGKKSLVEKLTAKFKFYRK
jgi:lysyl-tRNA synthetase class 2